MERLCRRLGLLSVPALGKNPSKRYANRPVHFYVSEALGKHQLPDPEHPQITIYPDPVQNLLKLYLPDAQPGPVDWVLYDMLGKKVQGGRFIYETGAFQPIRLTLSGSLSPGMYVFTLRNGSRSFTSRISKL